MKTIVFMVFGGFGDEPQAAESAMAIVREQTNAKRKNRCMIEASFGKSRLLIA
jgi:hypothetical protein